MKADHRTTPVPARFHPFYELDGFLKQRKVWLEYNCRIWNFIARLIGPLALELFNAKFGVLDT